MKAMILAAGYGTRLGLLTEQLPKALVSLAGRTLLNIVIDKLVRAGCSEIVINTHHYAKQISDFLASQNWPGLTIKVSHEDVLLNTGGGQARMMQYLQSDEPVLVHNVDVLTDLDFSLLIKHHLMHKALVTLAVQKRPTSRYLLFDKNMLLCGRAGEEKQKLPIGSCQQYAFNGIQVIDPKTFINAPHTLFSSIDYYIQLACLGASVIGFPMDCQYWRDLGKPSDLLQAEEDIRANKIYFSLVRSTEGFERSILCYGCIKKPIQTANFLIGAKSVYKPTN